MMGPCQKYPGRGEPDLSNSSTNRVRKLDMTRETKEAVMTTLLYRDSVDILHTISPHSNNNKKRQL